METFWKEVQPPLDDKEQRHIIYSSLFGMESIQVSADTAKVTAFCVFHVITWLSIAQPLAMTHKYKAATGDWKSMSPISSAELNFKVPDPVDVFDNTPMSLCPPRRTARYRIAYESSHSVCPSIWGKEICEARGLQGRQDPRGCGERQAPQWGYCCGCRTRLGASEGQTLWMKDYTRWDVCRERERDSLAGMPITTPTTLLLHQTPPVLPGNWSGVGWSSRFLTTLIWCFFNRQCKLALKLRFAWRRPDYFGQVIYHRVTGLWLSS